MRSFFRIIIFLLLSFGPAAGCFGGTLSISSRSTLTVSTERVRVDVFAENKGDESAYGVRAHLYIFDDKYSAAPVDQLEVKKNHMFQFTVPVRPDQRGEFPFVGEVLYYDVNRRPAAVLCAGTFKLGSSGGGLVSGRAPELTLAANESLPVQITIRDPAPRDVTATLYLPPSLATPQVRKNIRLKPVESATVEFPLIRRHGAGNATYPVFCILTYRDAGVSHAAVVQTVVHVKEFQNWFIITRWYWLGAGGLIVLGWAWIGIRKEGWRLKGNRLKDRGPMDR